MDINSILKLREIQASDFDFLIGMGVDLSKLLTREGLKKMFGEQLDLPIEKKAS